MKKLFTFICFIFLVGCATIDPTQKCAKIIRIPEADFRDANIADLIIFLVESVNHPAPIRVSIGIIQKPNPTERKQKKKQFQELYNICKNKTISLNAKNCPVLHLLDFVASCVGLKTKFIDDQLVIVTKNDKVIAK